MQTSILGSPFPMYADGDTVAVGWGGDTILQLKNPFVSSVNLTMRSDPIEICSQDGRSNYLSPLMSYVEVDLALRCEGCETFEGSINPLGLSDLSVRDLFKEIDKRIQQRRN